MRITTQVDPCSHYREWVCSVGLGLGIFMAILGMFTKRVDIFDKNFETKLVINFVESEWVCMNTISDRA